MFRNREEIRNKIIKVVEKFRQKGATTPEKALTAQELGLGPRFEQMMHRRLGQTGIFVEINGKYYLNEERLKQIQEQHKEKQASNSGSDSGRWQEGAGMRRTLMTMRFARLATLFMAVALVGTNLFVQSWTLRWISLGLGVVWLSLFAVYAYYVSRARKRFSHARFA
jgi:ABC-type bacteriocin/lantibiotic exporter with double-glycine peptidase domain